MIQCRKPSMTAEIACGYSVIEYFLRESMRAEGMEPERIIWPAEDHYEKIHIMVVIMEDRIAMELFLEDELLNCFNIPEYYRSIERRIGRLVKEIRNV